MYIRLKLVYKRTKGLCARLIIYDLFANVLWDFTNNASCREAGLVVAISEDLVITYMLSPRMMYNPSSTASTGSFSE